MVILGSLQDEFVETKHNGNILRYWTPIFGNIVVYVFKPIYQFRIITKNLNFEAVKYS